MAATAGLAPWSTGYKRLTKLQTSRSHVPGYGYVNTTSDWRKLPKHPPTRWLVNPLTGRKYKATSTDIEDFINTANVAGFNDLQFMQFAAEHGLNKDEAGLAEYVDYSFGEESKHTYKTEGAGHILFLEYNSDTTVMRVTFWDNSIVVYFRVPRQVFGELYALAKSDARTTHTFDGKERHMLGVRFWDLVRIRGSKHGSRYRFIYTQEGSYESQYDGPGRPNESVYTEVPYREKMSLRKLDEKELKDARKELRTIEKNLRDEYLDRYKKRYHIKEGSKINQEKFDNWLTKNGFFEELNSRRKKYRDELYSKKELDADVGTKLIKKHDPERAKELYEQASKFNFNPEDYDDDENMPEMSPAMKASYKDAKTFKYYADEINRLGSLLKGSAGNRIAAIDNNRKLDDIDKIIKKENILISLGLWDVNKMDPDLRNEDKDDDDDYSDLDPNGFRNYNNNRRR